VYNRFINWFDQQSNATKLILIFSALVALLLSLVLSPLIAVLASILLVLSIVMLLVRSRSDRPLRNWAIAAGASLFLAFSFGAVSATIYGEAPEEQQASSAKSIAEKSEPSKPENAQAQPGVAKADSERSSGKPEPAKEQATESQAAADEAAGPDYSKADYDGPGVPSEKPIEIVLRVSGSEGGAYKGWRYIDETSDFEDALNSISHTDKPHFRGVIGPQPKEYRFNLGDGVYKAPTGDIVWDTLSVDIKKAKRQGRDWEGEIYAELLVDGKVVSCSSTEPFDGLSVSYSPEDKEGGFFDTLNCEN
jgi:hypothetical protein